MGYGPLVRATTGVTWLWTSEGAKRPRGSFYDATTIFPDHVVGQASPRLPRWRRSSAVSAPEPVRTCIFRRPRPR